MQNCVGILCRVWDYVTVKRQGCNALCLSQMLGTANMSIWGECGSCSPPYMVVLHCCLPLNNAFWFFLSFSILLNYFVLVLPMLACLCFLAIISVFVFSLQYVVGRISMLIYPYTASPWLSHVFWAFSVWIYTLKLTAPKNGPEMAS